MSRSMLNWGIPAVLYGLFFFWYTSFGGPMTDDEIKGYVSIMN